MKTAAVFLAMCIATAPVTAVQQIGNTLNLDDEDMQEGRDGGGCLFVTRDALRRAVDGAAKMIACKDFT